MEEFDNWMQEWEEERRVARRERIVVGGDDAKLGAQLAAVVNRRML